MSGDQEMADEERHVHLGATEGPYLRREIRMIPLYADVKIFFCTVRLFMAAKRFRSFEEPAEKYTDP